MIKRIIKYLISIILIIMIAFAIYKIYLYEKEIVISENPVKLEENNKLPIPDRMIYKNEKNEFIMIDSSNVRFAKIYTELYNSIIDYRNGKVYGEDEISNMQNNGRFIEFDYNTKSKNYVFLFDEENIAIIKRSENSGQVVQSYFNNKSSLISSVNLLTKDVSEKYDFNIEYNLTSKNTLSELSKDIEIAETKVIGVYQKKFVGKYDEPDFDLFLKKMNFDIDQEMPKIDFDKQNVIVTISRYEIKNIRKNIGNIKYELGDFSDNYIVNIYVVSKVVNINCIYFNNDTDEFSVSTFSTTNKENGVEYFVQNGKYYANINSEKKELVSLERAAEISEKEAKKEKYQYQEWKSDFYCCRDSEEETISAELIYDLDSISKFSHWNENWKTKDYKEKLMWKIQLFDRNDPLTNLYIYIDALNGEVIGAGSASD